ncbi:2,4-diaminopentanoate dehydrogenase [Tepidimicrobium xylanilyticum]|uniref:2,4-diaminopentanoate:NAD(P)+ oxidoreductase n=1 Tax=Tepidimicrobium xylanilyticum TaxID=1123352 RepID=A0A1H2SQ70_9FIRM|nr:2,4-diaminopentanoate dehydrogenase [Tepidimicrobium xylanilyticum]GMG96163.1 dihydrodipicolinate reductase [Tepidimicrobium xylanilyticum]SDW33189.1 2,4-diaminopentanoate:NAD(P)+ oxidoreductase [Tepidimicrobium xylanilyticum]
MRKENIKVIIWGLGAMGKGMAEMLLNKKGVEIVGVVGRTHRLGKSMYDYLDVERGDRPDIIIGEYDKVITEKAADVVIIATDSFTRDNFEKIKYCLERKINVISTAEEMAYPQAQEPELAKELDRIAKENGVTVLGTGINPGLIMDLLVIALTGACIEVESIRAERVNNLSPFGPAVMEGQGVGLTVEEFNNRVKEGTLAGHVGFPESIRMIADAIGWKLSDEVELIREPIVSKVYRKAPHAEVQPGNVAGCNMKGFGRVDGEVKIEMLHPQQVEPQLEGGSTGDYITIKGTPNINMSIKPEVPGGIGTIAMCVNMIPHVINASPGLKTMIDLPVPRAIMGDMRELID